MDLDIASILDLYRLFLAPCLDATIRSGMTPPKSLLRCPSVDIPCIRTQTPQHQPLPKQAILIHPSSRNDTVS